MYWIFSKNWQFVDQCSKTVHANSAAREYMYSRIKVPENTDIREHRYPRMQAFKGINFDDDQHVPPPFVGRTANGKGLARKRAKRRETKKRKTTCQSRFTIISWEKSLPL